MIRAQSQVSFVIGLGHSWSQPIFANRFADTHLPVTEKLADEILTLPCHPALREEEIANVIDACNRFNPDAP